MNCSGEALMGAQGQNGSQSALLRVMKCGHQNGLGCQCGITIGDGVYQFSVVSFPTGKQRS